LLASQFTQVFREEHRKLRDSYLDIINVLQKRDGVALRPLIQQVNLCAGPHFRYEEEVLYPALLTLYARDYIEILLMDHDWAIATVRKLILVSHQDRLSDDDCQLAIRRVHNMLPHISDCDGLSIMVECLSSSEIQSIMDARGWSLQEGMDLLQWVDRVRKRVHVPL